MKKLQNNNPPIIKLPGLDLSDNQYVTGDDRYDISTLIQFCKEKDYQMFDMPLAGINLENMPFSVNSFFGFCNHIKRINNTNLDYPIIIDNLGYIADGWHRIAKAIITGKSTVKAIRMMEMPSPSSIEKKDTTI